MIATVNGSPQTAIVLSRFFKKPMNSKLELTVPSMACSACATTISDAVMTVDSNATVSADPKTKQVSINTEASESSVRQAIEAAGYPVS